LSLAVDLTARAIAAKAARSRAIRSRIAMKLV
jgi:hypothetical protein